MGFDCGFELKRYKKDDKHSRIMLCFMGNPGDCLDNLIIRYCEPGDEQVEYWEPVIGEQCVVVDYKKQYEENQGYEFKVTRDTVNKICKELFPLYKMCTKYSERVIDELQNFLDGYRETCPEEVSSSELSFIKDFLYDLGNQSDSNEPEIYSVMNVYNAAHSLAYLDEDFFKEEEIIYFRSW